MKGLNERRRNLLKLFALGGATFVLGKVLGPGLNIFGDSIKISDGETHDFKNFRVVEKNGELGFYDKFGNEILVMENE